MIQHSIGKEDSAQLGVRRQNQFQFENKELGAARGAVVWMVDFKVELELEQDDEEVIWYAMVGRGSAHANEGEGGFRDEDVW